MCARRRVSAHGSGTGRRFRRRRPHEPHVPQYDRWTRAVDTMLATEARLGQVAHQRAKLPGHILEQRGIEPDKDVETTAIRVDSRTDDPTRVDVSTREPVVFGPSKMHSAAGPLTVEDALAVALARASAAHEWAVVAQLVRELEARRLTAAGVRSLLDGRGRYPGPVRAVRRTRGGRRSSRVSNLRPLPCQRDDRRF